MTNIVGSGSVSQRHGSADPDPYPHQHVMDPEHCLKIFSRKNPGLKFGCISSVSSMVCMISSQNSRERWQFWSMSQWPLRIPSVIIFRALSSWPWPIASDRKSYAGKESVISTFWTVIFLIRTLSASLMQEKKYWSRYSKLQPVFGSVHISFGYRYGRQIIYVSGFHLNIFVNIATTQVFSIHETNFTNFTYILVPCGFKL